MTRSLYSKFILGYLIFGPMGFIAIATFSSRMTRDCLVWGKADALYDKANSIASSCSTMYQGRRLDSGEVSTQIRALSHYLKAEIWVVSRQGTVVMDSLDSSRVQPSVDGFDPVSIGNRPYAVGDYYGMFNGNVLSVSAPITGNYDTYGYVLIHLPISEINQSRSGILSILYTIFAVLFDLSPIILLVFTQTAYLPLHKIIMGTNEYVAGNLDYRINVKTHDEMGYLFDILNHMSNELNGVEEYQKNFIANVSHGSRSPLISVKGYLEAALDGIIPAKTYEKYPSKVISEAEHLHKLIENTLTLSSLDARGYLSRTNFSINHIMEDMAASFEGIYEFKDVSSDLIFSDDIQMVFADLGKVQQIMYNLTDNAVKFSHHDSVIYIQTSGRHEKIFVPIRDTGIGIPKDSLRKIWERFCKIDLSRGKDKEGTGLGLSIVKEIIQAHGENIDVVSIESAGTEFTLLLLHSASLQVTPARPDYPRCWECSPT